MELTSADLARIVEAFEASEWQHLRVSLGGSLLELSKSGPVKGAAMAAASAAGRAVAAPSAAGSDAAGSDATSQLVTAPPMPGATTSLICDDAGLDEIVSPSVGVFWRAPNPASPPFVSEGHTVGEADTVCIVEVMKLMNHVASSVSGTVRRAACIRRRLTCTVASRTASWSTRPIPAGWRNSCLPGCRVPTTLLSASHGPGGYLSPPSGPITRHT